MIKVKRLVAEARVPTRSHESDAGFDLYSIEEVSMSPLSRRVIKTGISIELPNRGVRNQEIYARLAPRSGMAVNNGIHVLAGVVDRGYTGEILVCLFNSDKDNSFQISKGDRIAQLIPTIIYKDDFMEVEELEGSVRGVEGMGSTGV